MVMDWQTCSPVDQVLLMDQWLKSRVKRVCLTCSQEHLVRRVALQRLKVARAHRFRPFEVAQRLSVVEHRRIALQLLAAHLGDKGFSAERGDVRSEGTSQHSSFR